MNRCPRPRESGFTMLEIIMAIGLMSICLFPVLAFNQRNLREAVIVREEIMARQYLMNMCERFKNEDPKVLERLSNNAVELEKDRLIQSLQEGARYDLKRNLVFEKNYSGTSGIHRITFEVTWKSDTKRTKLVSLKRLIHFHY